MTIDDHSIFEASLKEGQNWGSEKINAMGVNQTIHTSWRSLGVHYELENDCICAQFI